MISFFAVLLHLSHLEIYIKIESFKGKRCRAVARGQGAECPRMGRQFEKSATKTRKTGAMGRKREHLEENEKLVGILLLRTGRAD